MAIAPPRPKGPHLNALRAFEAAARLGSFTAAAEELGVTPGAITQHIKALEEWTNAPLFIRNARGVAATAITEELLPGFSAAFDQLGEAVQNLRAQASPRKLSIATLPSIAQLWLPKKLETLRKADPQITVSVTALEVMPNLSREPFDLAIFFNDGPLLSTEYEIQRDQIFPVCTPEIADTLKELPDLKNATLLHDTTWANDWNLWLGAVGGEPVGRLDGQKYSLFSVALEEARRGAGVLISHRALVENALQSGELVRPFPQMVEPPRSLTMRTTSSFERRAVFDTVKAVFCQTAKS